MLPAVAVFSVIHSEEELAESGVKDFCRGLFKMAPSSSEFDSESLCPSLPA